MNPMESFIFDISIIVVVAAVLSILAFLFKQPIIIAYIACGALIGPWGMGLIKSPESVEVISHLGITLLLFLAGLCLHPEQLVRLFKKTAIITLSNCSISFVIVFIFVKLFSFSLLDCIIIASALMFSSTILLVKLMPTTTLHHERMGATCIAILIFQDIMAILILALIRSLSNTDNVAFSFLLLMVKLIALIVVLMIVERYVLRKLIFKIDKFHELVFILGLAWCFGIAGISYSIGLFFETGAFFAGVALARQPISLFLSEKLKPIRDFFLVLFFFTLGAKLDFLVMKSILLPALILGAILLVIKPLLFRVFFRIVKEKTPFAKEAGIRLGQLSEFSLLIALLAFELGHISAEASQLIQLTTIVTIIVSSYVVVLSYTTPIGTKDKLVRD